MAYDDDKIIIVFIAIIMFIVVAYIISLRSDVDTLKEELFKVSVRLMISESGKSTNGIR